MVNQIKDIKVSEETHKRFHMKKLKQGFKNADEFLNYLLKNAK